MTPSTANEIDLTKFCSTESTRYAILIPWVKNGWRYATDGKILVRVPTDEPDTPQEAGRFPDADHLFQDNPTPTLPWPAREVVDGKECEDCDGSGECKTCGTEGKCPECDGAGQMEPDLQVIGKYYIQKKYDDLIRPLANVVYATIKFAIGAKINFVFDGGEGQVMSYAKP